MPVSLSEIRRAARRIHGGVIRTPCVESPALSELTGAQVFCKLENQQRTGSFKERGARNALLQLSREQKRRGVIAASAGNHASALAYHGQLLHVPVTVVMPATAPLIKISTCEKLGARVILHGTDFEAARAHADQEAARLGLLYVNGFDDDAIIAGQGTIGLELIEQVRNLECVVVPVGGGGLIAGIAIAIKALRPQVRVIGVESTRTASFSAALAAGHPVHVRPQPTLADGLAIAKAGANAFTLAAPRIDELRRVSEDRIAQAIVRTLELEKSVVEGAAAATLAALMSPGDGKRESKLFRGKRVALLFAGGNIDPLVLSRVIEKGLVADGRRFRFSALISDRPGGLARLAELIAQAGASVSDIAHDRAFSGTDVSKVQTVCTVETRDRRHIRTLLRKLRGAGIDVERIQ